MITTDTLLGRLAQLKTTPTAELKKQWRDLFDMEPPPYNRRFLESRLAYRIQELAYGGLKPEIIERLEALGEQLDGGDTNLKWGSSLTIWIWSRSVAGVIHAGSLQYALLARNVACTRSQPNRNLFA
jgi:hypothetical protein